MEKGAFPKLRDSATFFDSLTFQFYSFFGLFKP